MFNTEMFLVNILDLLDFKVTYDNGNTFDSLISLITGISGGLLSLVGLIAIFLSINTQHNMERAREILWELDFAEELSEKKIITYIQQYKTLLKLSLPITLVVIVAIVTIVFVGLLWANLWITITKLGIYQNYFTSFLFLGSIFILFLFFALLLLLPITRWFGGLPKWESIINGSEVKFPVLTLFSRTVDITITRFFNKPFEIFLRSSKIPFYNIRISGKIICAVSGEQEHRHHYRFEDYIITRDNRGDQQIKLEFGLDNHFPGAPAPEEIDLDSYETLRIFLYIIDKENPTRRLVTDFVVTPEELSKGIYVQKKLFFGNSPGFVRLQSPTIKDRLKMIISRKKSDDN